MDLSSVKDLKTVDIKGKPYVEVKERVKAFRKICHDSTGAFNGSIETEVVSFGEYGVLVKAVIKDEHGVVVATGHASEKESKSGVNATSYIENAETSAVGRALGFLGIGIDTAIASASEVEKAQEAEINEIKELKIAPLKVDILKKKLREAGIPYDRILKLYKIEAIEELTELQFRNINDHWKEIEAYED